MDDALAARFGMPSGKKPTHRGRRSRGKGPMPAPEGTDHHAIAQGHAANAASSNDPATTKAHLFKALSSLKKC